MYAIIETGGKQYKVEKDRYFLTEKIDAAVGQKIELPCLMVTDDNGKIKTGSPYLKTTKVIAEVLEHGKDDKIVVFKYKAKKNERKRQGHRQPYTKLKIVSIG